MKRTQRKVDTSHDVTAIIMQSTTEAVGWERIFPPNMPSTHRLAYRWITVDGMPAVEVGPELIARPIASSSTDAPASEEPEPGAGDEADRVALDALSEANLLTMAGELQITPGRRWSKAKLIAEILKAQKAQAPALV